MIPSAVKYLEIIAFPSACFLSDTTQYSLIIRGFMGFALLEIRRPSQKRQEPQVQYRDMELRPLSCSVSQGHAVQ